MARRLCLALLLLLLAAPSAQAVNPETAVGGASSKWFSGNFIQQTGLNCSTAILGSSYTEVMVSGVASYGGLPSVPRVGQEYWTSLLLAIPGNPCGSGSSSVSTDVLMPPGTTFDSSRPIRCFGQGRTQSTFGELTGGNWSFLGSSGPYCPASVTNSFQHQGAVHVGFRPLANGQFFQIFVPVKSTQALVGMGNNTHAFRWLTNATGVYANPGLSTAWANVFDGPSGNAPVVYFARQPAAVPFWKGDADPGPPTDRRNRVEFFANAYTAGLAGKMCFEVRRVVDDKFLFDCDSIGFDGNVPAGLELVQAVPLVPETTGPNGGYVPVSFDPPSGTDPIGEWGQDMTIRWSFDPDGPAPAVSQTVPFKTLPGPDTDGDGVADASDACPNLKGVLADGCNEAVKADPDKDGIYDDADKCPAVDGKGALNGCPGGIIPDVKKPETPPVVLGGSVGLKKGAKIKRAQLLKKGATIPVTCTKDSNATASLSVTKAVAKKLKIKTKSKSVTIGSAKGACKASGGGQLKLKVAKKYKKQLTRAKKSFAATLSLKLSGGAEKASAKGLSVKVG